MRAVVVGAGVVGLSCAVRLAEAGHSVGVLARDLPLETTSSVAAAIWYPHLVSPQERVLGWAAVTYRELVELADAEPSIRLRTGTEYLVEHAPDPWWAASVPDLRRVAAPDGFADGWSFTAPVAEMPQYLSYLVARLERAGGTLQRATVSELPDRADVVVNCTGLGARRIVGDPDVSPVRGQVIYLSQPGLTQWLIAARESGLTYVVPREHDVVVGGTSEPDQWDLTPDPDVAREILARATDLVPQLRGAPVLGHRVGLRPYRLEVRCEAARVDRRLVVHCYGHGGAGVTVSWGCADEILGYLQQAGR